LKLELNFDTAIKTVFEDLMQMVEKYWALSKLVYFHSYTRWSTQQVANIFPAYGPVLTRWCCPPFRRWCPHLDPSLCFPRLRKLPTPAYHNARHVDKNASLILQWQLLS